MNRIIKFRGKRKDNGEWGYGFVQFCMVDGDLTKTKKRVFITYETMDEIGKVYSYTSEVDPETVGEYIPRENFYEGDIVYGYESGYFGAKVCSWYGVVKYNEDAGRIQIQDNDEDWFETDEFDYESIKGNIHDNPYLMKPYWSE